MDKTAADSKDAVTHVLGQLLRQPEPQRDLELERALVRLQAARSDAAYLMLHRLMVLETALAQLQQPTTVAAGSREAVAASGPGLAPRPLASRSFLRDAAVVTAGVVAGQALFQGLADAPFAGTDGVEGLDIDGWL